MSYYEPIKCPMCPDGYMEVEDLGDSDCRKLVGSCGCGHTQRVDQYFWVRV